MTYHHLTREERYLISKDKSIGMSMRAIARRLGRSASSVSRDLRRNADRSSGRFRFEKAHGYACARLRRCRRGPNFSAAALEPVHALLRRRWSPEQISGRLARHKSVAVSTSTIYRRIASDKRRGGQLWTTTRRLSHRYRKGYRVKDSRGRMGGKVPLALRPEAANLRQEFAHWEGDTVMGSDGRHCLLTLVERKTRFVRIIKLAARQAALVNAALAQELGPAGHLIVRSLALDNGTEFHGFADITKRFGTDIYFAQPYHSWERGTNENTNGLIRQYLPKRSCFSSLTQAQCDAIQLELNTRPRKVLDYRTPSEAYIDECCT